MSVSHEHPALDTLVAVATATGSGALATVRLSGPRSHSILQGLCPGLPDPLPLRNALVRTLLDPSNSEILDQCVVIAYGSPRSFTGEDVVEISCHGGLLVPGMIREACLRLGARAAEPGEFSRRAYLNGKIDLLQAEAILDLTGGTSRALHRTAIHQLERGLSRRVTSLRESLVEIEALLMHHLDFPEEDEPPVPIDRVADRAGEVAAELDRLLRTSPEGELLREGAVTVLAGRPNSGKSSLFNALIGTERAIVTEIPGTTRDALEATVSMSGFPFRLVDTAGLRDADERVERLGIEVAHRYVERADLLLLCVGPEVGWGSVEEEFLSVDRECPVVVVRTKSDLNHRSGSGAFPGSVSSPVASELPGIDRVGVEVSARTGEGLDRLRELLPSLVFRGLVNQGVDQPVFTRTRQTEAAGRALAEVRAFEAAIRSGVHAEVASTHLRSAETALEELLGVITSDEVMDRLFRDFCIGK